VTELTKEEKDVLQALNDLEPATQEEIATMTGLSVAEVQRILAGLKKRGFLGSLDQAE
jgi:DNA-binding MarR family transcriptional regulator